MFPFGLVGSVKSSLFWYRRWNSGRHHLQRPPAGRSHMVHFIPLLCFLAGGKTAPDGTLPRRWLQAWRPHGLLNVWHGPGCAKRSTDFDSRWILVSKLLCLNTTTPPPLIHIGTRQMLHLFWPFCLAYRLASPESEFHPTNPCWKGTVTLEAGRKIRVDTVHSV